MFQLPAGEQDPYFSEQEEEFDIAFDASDRRRVGALVPLLIWRGGRQLSYVLCRHVVSFSCMSCQACLRVEQWRLSALSLGTDYGTEMCIMQSIRTSRDDHRW